MTDSPNYSFYRHPRFSVNHVADYFCAGNAKQREDVIRSAKFPRKATVIPYSDSKRTICGFLGKNIGDVSQLSHEISRLKTRLSSEPEGWARDELKRNIACLEAFKKAFGGSRPKRFKYSHGPSDLTMSLEGVRINTRLDLTISEKDKEGIIHAGGCVMIIASTDSARKKLGERQRLVAAMIHWNLQELASNIAPKERLCVSYDVFGNSFVTAPTAIDRLRNYIRISCKEAANSWDGVEPPSGYDGPDWR